VRDHPDGQGFATSPDGVIARRDAASYGRAQAHVRRGQRGGCPVAGGTDGTSLTIRVRCSDRPGRGVRQPPRPAPIPRRPTRGWPGRQATLRGTPRPDNDTNGRCSTRYPNAGGAAAATPPGRSEEDPYPPCDSRVERSPDLQSASSAAERVDLSGGGGAPRAATAVPQHPAGAAPAIGGRRREHRRDARPPSRTTAERPARLDIRSRPP
jgi:hypothetical protein